MSENPLRELVRVYREYIDEMARLRMLPYGSIMNYHGSGGRSSETPGGNKPAGVGHPECDAFAEAWMRCRSLKQREELVRQMREELKNWKHTQAVDAGETQKQLYARIVKVGEGWADRECAASLRQTVSTVHEARKAHNRDPAKGLPLSGATAQELMKRGNSVRQVAELLKTKKSTLYDRTRKAA